MISLKDYHDMMSILGFTAINKALYISGDIECSYKGDTLTIQQGKTIYVTTKIANAIRHIECSMQTGLHSMPITAAINTKNLAQNMIRVRSSNVWSIGFNVRKQGDNTGDLVMQFKNKNGGAGDVYIYFDVSIKDYKRLLNAPSVGHQFWVSIRNNHSYSKLSGDKIGKLKNAINH